MNKIAEIEGIRLQILGAITEGSPEERAAYEAASADIRARVAAHGDSGLLVATLIFLENVK